MTEKCESFFIFHEHLNKSTRKINSYFTIITQILNTSKAELAVNFNKSKMQSNTNSYSFCADNWIQ